MNPEDIKTGKAILARSVNKNNKNPDIAQKIEKAATFEEAANIAASAVGQDSTNSLAGNVFNFIAQQEIDYPTIKADDIFGMYLHEYQDSLDVGGGVDIQEDVVNSAGNSEPINYQTSTLPAGDIYFGTSFSNTSRISLRVLTTPLGNPDPDLKVNVYNSLQKTIPETLASFNGMNAINFKKIVEGYHESLRNGTVLYKYFLGNAMVKTYKPKNVITDTTSADIYQFFTKTLIPTILNMRKVSDQYNAGSTAKTTWVAAYDTTSGKYQVAPGSYQKNVLQVGSLANYKILMNSNVSATLMSMLSVVGMPAGNSYASQIEGSGSVVSRILGIPVHVVGNDLTLTQQSAQGTAPVLGTSGSNILEDNEILIIDEELFGVKKVYEMTYTTDVSPAAMVRKAITNVAYLPYVKWWKNGITITSDALTKEAVLNVRSIEA